jgi:type IV secretory pathway TraG/TraD family ATPase VirD4
MSKQLPHAQPDQLAIAQAMSIANNFGVFLGNSDLGPVFAPAEHGVLVLGPPRAGKSTALAMPNLFCSTGSVLAVSTKPDLIAATLGTRSRLGPTLLFDPDESTAMTGLSPIGWSPLHGSLLWDQAVLTADAMVGAARGGTTQGAERHWNERAGALLSALFHAGALGGQSMADLLRSVNRREAGDSISTLGRHNSFLAMDLLVGITETDAREQSGIWSTASGILAAYRTERALTSSDRSAFDPVKFVQGRETLYICASGDTQGQIGPLVAGILRDIRTAAYREAARSQPTARPRPPVLFILDELANIAPIHDLPALIAEGGSQGIVTIACLQDLSQARTKWGAAADGFFSLFGAKVVLSGIGDIRTLEAISVLAGEVDVTTVSTSKSRRRQSLIRDRSTTTGSRRQRRLPPDVIANRPRDHATLLLGSNVSQLSLTPAYRDPLWRDLMGRPHVATVTTDGCGPAPSHSI